MLPVAHPVTQTSSPIHTRKPQRAQRPIPTVVAHLAASQFPSRKRGQGWRIRERDARDAAHSDPLGLPQVPTLASCRGLEPRRGHRDIETPIQSKTLTLSLDVKPTRACGPDQPITAVWYSATFQAQGSAWSDRAIADTTGHGVAATAHPISTRPSP